MDSDFRPALAIYQPLQSRQSTCTYNTCACVQTKTPLTYTRWEQSVPMLVINELYIYIRQRWTVIIGNTIPGNDRSYICLKEVKKIRTHVENTFYACSSCTILRLNFKKPPVSIAIAALRNSLVCTSCIVIIPIRDRDNRGEKRNDNRRQNEKTQQ